MSDNKKMDEIRASLAEKLHVDHIDEGQSLKDIGLDSLGVVEMCLDLEDRYGIQFPAEELGEFQTIGDVLKSIEAKIEGK